MQEVEDVARRKKEEEEEAADQRSSSLAMKVSPTFRLFHVFVHLILKISS